MKPRYFRSGDRLVRVELTAQPVGVSDEAITAAPFLLTGEQVQPIVREGTPLRLTASTEDGAIERVLKALAQVGYEGAEEVTYEEWIRRHDNGWLGLVWYVKELGRFVGGGLPVERSGSMGSYRTVEEACAAADREVREKSDHATCTERCQPWRAY